MITCGVRISIGLSVVLIILIAHMQFFGSTMHRPMYTPGEVSFACTTPGLFRFVIARTIVSLRGFSTVLWYGFNEKLTPAIFSSFLS